MGIFLDREALVAMRATWKEQGKKVVFTNGCYDLLSRFQEKLNILPKIVGKLSDKDRIYHSNPAN